MDIEIDAEAAKQALNVLDKVLLGDIFLFSLPMIFLTVSYLTMYLNISSTPTAF